MHLLSLLVRHNPKLNMELFLLGTEPIIYMDEFSEITIHACNDWKKSVTISIVSKDQITLPDNYHKH